MTTCRREMLLGTLGACAVALAACCPAPRAPDAGNAGDGTGSTPGSTSGTRLSTLQRDIFDKHCVTDCHEGASAGAALTLAAGRSYGALVNQRSQEISTQIRVVPGDPAASYLVKKMVGGPGISISGDVMPKGAAPRPASEIDALRAWVTRGAPDD